MGVNIGTIIIHTIFQELGTNNPEDVDLSKVAPHRLEIDKVVLKAIGFSDEEIPEILKELYAELIDLVKSRLERAKSVEGQKRKANTVQVDMYVAELETLLEEEGIEVENSYHFAKELQHLIKRKITDDKKLGDKVLKAFWKKHFGKALNLSMLEKEVQGGLF